MARAFRRSVSTKRRPFSRVSRLQTPHRPRKWERGNFYVLVDHEHAEGTEDLLTILPIAYVGAIVDNQATDTGRALAQAVRCIEVGGLVYNFCITPQNFSGFVPPAQGDAGFLDARILLVSDRLDSGTPPAPVCLTTNWFTNTQPIASVNEGQDEQQTFPTQIHQQDFRRINYTSMQLADVAGDYPGTQTVEQQRGAKNVRLRLRLQDDEVLAFHLASRTRSGSETLLNLGLNITLVGTIFYRFVFAQR